MALEANAIVCALVELGLSPVPAFAFGGVGCPGLPEYDRALGTIENGPGSCDMSVAEAQRILARHDAQTVVQPAAPLTHASRKHHRGRSHQT